MKKIVLIGMIIIGALSYGRDYEYMERDEKKLQIMEEKLEKDGRIAEIGWNIERKGLQKENSSEVESKFSEKGMKG